MPVVGALNFSGNIVFIWTWAARKTFLDEAREAHLTYVEGDAFDPVNYSLNFLMSECPMTTEGYAGCPAALRFWANRFRWARLLAFRA